MLESESQTGALGRALALHLRLGDTLALRGELGAGKTTLARAVIGAMCGPCDVPSPTYTLVQQYDTAQGELWHADMYRLNAPQDCLELGLEDAFLDAICLIEWPERLGHFLPETAIDLTLEFSGAGRKAKISGAAHWIEQLEVI